MDGITFKCLLKTIKQYAKFTRREILQRFLK